MAAALQCARPYRLGRAHLCSRDAFHAAELRAGGRDNDAPGLRSVNDPDYHAAFIIVPGYRIEAYYGPGEK